MSWTDAPDLYTYTREAVRLRLRRKFAPLLLRSLKLPSAFPRSKPIGCAKHPVAPGPGFVVGCSSSASRRSEKVDSVSALWSRVIDDLEADLRGICNVTNQAHFGTKDGASEVLRPVMPRRAAGPKGAIAQPEFAMVWGANRLKELLVRASCIGGAALIAEGRLGNGSAWGANAFAFGTSWEWKRGQRSLEQEAALSIPHGGQRLHGRVEASRPLLCLPC